MQPLRRNLAAAVVFSLLAWWCQTGAAQQVHDVSIRDYQFAPSVVHAKAGDTVRWTNNERRASHSVFFTGAVSQESDRIFPGESWQRLFDKPGTYSYTCGPHPEMSGTVIVTE